MQFSDLVKTYTIPDSLLNDAKKYLNESNDAWSTHRWTYESKDGLGHKDPIENENEEPSILRPKDHEMSFNLCNPFLAEYVKSFPKSGCTTFTLIRFNRYTKNQYMSSHVDHITSLFKSQTRGIPVLSVVGLINKPSKGGEFVMTFPDGSSQEFLDKEGTVIIFPSVFIFEHEVKPVIDGVRDSYVSWVHY